MTLASDKSLNANWRLLAEHQPDVFDGDVVIFSAGRRRRFPRLRIRRPGTLARMAFRYQQRSWGPYVSGTATEHQADCTHDEMLSPAALSEYGEYFRRQPRAGG